MSLSIRLLFIAVFQVVITSIITYWLVADEYIELSEQSLETLESFMIEQKQQELKNYTYIAISAVDHLYRSSDQDNTVVKSLVADIFDSMLYNGDDGYFFVYDGQGVSIAHPKEPFRIGKSFWELESTEGEKMIQILLKNAKAGGGFYRYPWLKPSLQEESEKMGYSVYLPKWDWMVGTGVYLDDVNSQLSILQNEIDRHINKTKQIILLVAISSIFIIFLFGLIVNLSHKKKTDLKISELGQKIINLQEEERRYFSRELHDGIIQILVSIKYSLEATSIFLKKAKQAKPVPLEHAEANLVIAIQEIRRISHHLHPRILDELGLSAAMDALSKEFSQRTNVFVNVTKPAVRKLLPDHINTTLYRVVQESLNNIEKHANATNVAIHLSIQNDWLTLLVKDDGSGFDNGPKADKAEFGIGLRNLAERVEYHSGKFDISSSNKGTVIKAEIPTASFVIRRQLTCPVGVN
jgi:two-component system NarL family sensor kinase